MFAMFAIFAQLRFQEERTFSAEFTNVSSLKVDDFVRIAGVEVGKVKEIHLKPDTTAVVKFSADDTVVLTEGTRAVIRYADLIGGRYLGLEEGVGETKTLPAGATVPCAGPRPGQCPFQSADPGTPGAGRDHQLVSQPDRGSDKHSRGPRRAHRASDREPQHRARIAR
jgi:hypothetical protein